MKIWVDDVRPAPHGYIQAYSTNQAKLLIEAFEALNIISSYKNVEIEVIDLDHDAGDYAYDGGDYIKILDWLEETARNYPIRIHTMNPVGRKNMVAIVTHNGWKLE